MKKKDWIALLTIDQFPKTKVARNILVNWLRSVATEINKSDPKIYTEKPKFRLMK